MPELSWLASSLLAVEPKENVTTMRRVTWFPMVYRGLYDVVR